MTADAVTVSLFKSNERVLELESQVAAYRLLIETACASFRTTGRIPARWIIQAEAALAQEEL